MKNKIAKRNLGRVTGLGFAPVSVAFASVIACAGTAYAGVIKTDVEDLKMSLDTTARYNAGWRVAKRDPGLANNLAQDESNYLFDRGDMINNRVELFSEFDLKYKENMGFRVSGLAWFDAAYGSQSKALPGSPVAAQNIKGVFNSETERYYHGPSAEFRDAFVWASGKLGETDIVGRVGRHAVIWGEGLVGNSQSVSYSQAPNDGRKSVSSPGASAKETALPIKQFTGTWSFSEVASLSWQRTFEWKSNRPSLGGTYVGPDAFSDFVSGTIPRAHEEKGDDHATGLMLKWRPLWLDGELGVVYRNFSDTNPWAAQIGAGPTGRYVFARDITLLGLTFNKNIGDFNVGAEVSHRRNMALNTISGNAGPDQRYEGPIGSTWHALLNGTVLFNKNAVWDTASLVGELSYTRLDEVTRNAQFYKSRSNTTAAGIAACGTGSEVLKSCSTRSASQVAFIFTPQWLQVAPSLDVTWQTVYVMGVKGTAPANGGGNESSGQYKTGLTLDYRNKHKVELAYTKFAGKNEYTGAVSGGVPIKTTVGGGTFADRDYVSVTYTTNF